MYTIHFHFKQSPSDYSVHPMIVKLTIALCIFSPSSSQASELQAWLLFYSLPVMSDLLSSDYLQHYGLLVGAVYILLSDSISVSQLDFAEQSLTKFYEEWHHCLASNI